MQDGPIPPRPQDLLRLEASASQELDATHVEVRLQVTSSSSVRSSEASRAIEEIAELIDQLGELGIEPGQAEIQSATVAEGKGLFGRGSTASFLVVVDRVPPDQLVGVLQVATKLSHTEHLGTDWRFDIGSEVEEQLLGRAAGKARRRAEVAAEALGSVITGVESCAVSLSNEGRLVEVAPMPMGGAALSKRSLTGSVQSAAGIELTQRMRLTATASAAFHLGAK